MRWGHEISNDIEVNIEGLFFSHEGASEKFCFLDPYVLFTLKVEDVEQHEFFT